MIQIVRLRVKDFTTFNEIEIFRMLYKYICLKNKRKLEQKARRLSDSRSVIYDRSRFAELNIDAR